MLVPLRRTLCLLVAFCLTWLALLPPRAKATALTPPEQGSAIAAMATVPLQPGSLSAKSAALMDADSGQLLYEHNTAVRLPMASTTKLMTALCAVELCDPEKVIAADAAAVGIEGSSIYLQVGEQLTLRQLLYALLLQSANDAAAAIAIGVSGSIEAFVAAMNQRAADLGLTQTHFENPHGLDGEAHYTTAADLALIARAALSHPLLKTIMATRRITIPKDGGEGVRVLVNHNKMLTLYDGACGGKTGFTKKSGRCLVSVAEREGLCLIAVTLSAPDDWRDHQKLLDAGFAAYERVELTGQTGYATPLPLAGGCESYVLVKNAGTTALTLPRDRGALLCTVELPPFLYAPTAAGDVVGRLVFRCDTNGDGRTELLAEIPLVTAYAIERAESPSLWRRLLRFLHLARE